jgi:glucosamine 6-phosphate synthetase-like amidotransferase/phosphosugar isomerase protein
VEDQIDALPNLIEKSLPTLWQVASDHAAGTADRALVYLSLAAGPHLSSARFFARKLFEIPQLAVMVQDSEEYAHDQYSFTAKGHPVVMWCPPGAAASRDDELLRSLSHLETELAVVTETGRPMPDGVNPRWRYDVAPGLDELLAPLLHSLPAQVYSYEIGKRLGGSFYAFADAVHKQDGDPLIYESRIEEDARAAG